MIVLTYNPNEGLCLPDSRIISHAMIRVEEYASLEDVYRETVSSTEILTAYRYAMCKQEIDPEQLVIWCGKDEVVLDENYDFIGEDFFSNHVEECIMYLLNYHVENKVK